MKPAFERFASNNAWITQHTASVAKHFVPLMFLWPRHRREWQGNPTTRNLPGVLIRKLNQIGWKLSDPLSVATSERYVWL